MNKRVERSADENIPEISAYRKLQLIFNEGEDQKLTEKGRDVLDEMFGKDPEPNPTFLEKLYRFFKSIDSKLFPKGPKITNIYHRRK